MAKTTRIIPKLISLLNLLICPIAYGDSPFYLMTFGEYGLAKIAGFNQIPRGGSQDSSSYRRPNFNELNIEKESYHTFGIGLQLHSWQMLYSHSAIHLEKSAMLNESLFSHGQPLPADILYHFNLAPNKHQVQLKKYFPSLPKNNNFHFALFSNIDWLGYHYHFYPLNSALSATAPSSRRDFTNLSFSIGTEFQYQWHPYFSSAIDLSTSLPFFHLQIAEAKFIQRFHMLNRHLTKFTPYMGLSYLKIDLQDKQDLANHLRFTAKPYVFVGIEFLLI
jgi:hypothetical protein